MADRAFVEIRLKEIRPIYAAYTADSGTLTIRASPVPSCTLLDSDGTPVTGVIDVPVTGYDIAAAAGPRVWYDLDSTALTNGLYTLAFKYSATGSDTLDRIYEPTVTVYISRLADT